MARLSGLAPAGVICELMNADGTMARGPDLARFAAQHGLKIVSVANLAVYAGGLVHRNLVFDEHFWKIVVEITNMIVGQLNQLKL